MTIKENEAIEILEEERSGSDAAEIVKRIMEREEVNQTMLAEKMGCARQNICQMLNRGSISMRYDSFYKAVRALGYEVIVRKNNT